MQPDTPIIKYLNTDLDLEAPIDLTPLHDALNALGVMPLGPVSRGEDGSWLARFETKRCLDAPEDSIVLLLAAIEALSDEARELWNQCTVRELNVGYDCGDEPWGFNQALSHSTIQRMAAVGASLGITIYPHRARP